MIRHLTGYDNVINSRLPLKKLNSVALVRERTIPTERRRLSAKSDYTTQCKIAGRLVNNDFENEKAVVV
jgi:hypothetical protein